MINFWILDRHDKKEGLYEIIEKIFTDPVVNFAQLTQRAGNFLVAREEMPDFSWDDLRNTRVLGGRKGGVHISM